MKPALRDGRGAAEGAGELAGDGTDGVSAFSQIGRLDGSVLEAGGGADGPESGFERVGATVVRDRTGSQVEPLSRGLNSRKS
jgi:hypothetical protein